MGINLTDLVQNLSDRLRAEYGDEIDPNEVDWFRVLDSLNWTPERKLFSAIERIERIFNSNANWEFKYDIIFKSNKDTIRPLLTELGLSLEWYDPDTSYQEDVTAYVTALLRMKSDLEKVLP